MTSRVGWTGVCEYMQTVDQKWYVLYRWLTLGVGGLVLLFAGACWFFPQLLPIEPIPEISYFSGILALLTVLFAAFLYGRIAAKTTHLEAMLLLVMFHASLLFSIVQTTGQMESVFIWWWAVMSFIAGIFSVYGSASVAFVSVMYFILSSTDMHGSTEYSSRALTTLGVLVVAAGIGQLFWKRFFVDADTEKVAQLSGKLKTNQKQSEILIHSLTDGVVLIDTEGTITLMNPAAASMTGWSVEDGMGTDCRSVISLKNENGSDLDESTNPLSKLRNMDSSGTSTLQMSSRDGKQIIISLVVSPVKDVKSGGTIGIVAVMRDISATHQSDKQRAEFISTASHEMRTPVAAIEGYLQLALNEKVSKIDPKARDFLEKALDSTHHLGQLFQDLLTSAKAEDGRLVSHPTVVELGEYLEKLSESFKFSAEKKGLLTDFVLGTSSSAGETAAGSKVVRPLYYVHVDADRLREVVTNLFDNAVKYTPQGKVTVGLTGNNDVVQLFVKDTGPGIPADDVPHLFQKFYRVDNSATRTIGGTGLGLFISRKIIEMYKGRVWVESTLGSGSTFYINLPRVNTQRAEELKRQEAQNLGQAPIPSLTTPI